MKWYPLNESCVVMNPAGVEYEEFSCVYPSIGHTYTPFERNYKEINRNLLATRDWMVKNPVVPIAAVLAYGTFIILGQRYFSARKPWNLRGLMALWNLGLSVFSAIGFIRTAPHLLSNFLNYSLNENFCFDPEAFYGSGTTGLWVQLFILSKFPELLDTFFIVVHKKNLIFLHWYHHISVLLYCWNSYVTKAPVGLIFCVMNYAVHSIMYFYYFLMAVNLKPKAFNAVYITVAQISQMVVGVAVTIKGCHLLWVAEPIEGCWLTPDNNTAALVMYGSYLFLFVEFFVQRYYFSSKSGKKKTAASKKQSTEGSSSIKGVKVE